jgi:hypothetical protein
MSRLRRLARALGSAGLVALVACEAIVGVRTLSLADAGLAAAAAPDAGAADAPTDAPSSDAACARDQDPANCGECGYACPGTACSAGTCEPALIATSAAGGRGLVLADDGFLFWASPPSGGVMSVGKFTSIGTGAQASPPGYAVAVTTYRARAGESKQAAPVVSWAEALPGSTPQVRRCTTSVGMCLPPPEPIRAYAPGVFDLSAPSPFDVCWTERADAGAVRCLQNGSTPRDLATGVSATSALVALPEGVYFGVEGGLAFCPLAGCTGAPALLATSTPVVAVAVSVDGSVYYATRGGEVLRAAIGPAGPTAGAESLASTQGTITALSAGERRVYWTTLGADAASGALVAFTLATRTVRTLARGQHAPRGVASDDLRVFWLVSGEDVGQTSVFALPR